MKREVELRRRLRSLDALGAAVGAMKSLSAHHLREVRTSIEPARAYREGVERVLAWSGASLGSGTQGAGLLVIGAELGLCGSYNVQVVDAATRHRASLGKGPTFCVGHRAAALLARRGIEVAQSYAAPTSTDGMTPLLLRLAEDVLTTYAGEQWSSFDIVSSRFAGVGNTCAASVRLLPLVAKPVAQARRAGYVRPDALAFAAIREYLYITLYDLLLDALASEYGARLIATQSAQKWIEEHTTRLHRHVSATRREASTQEVIEIAIGARASAGRASAGSSVAQPSQVPASHFHSTVAL